MSSARVRAKTFVRIWERSSSLAAHLDTDSGEYVTKLTNNPEGPRVLINDWIGSSLAQTIGVLTPSFALVEIPEVLHVPLRAGLEGRAGVAFGSRFERGQIWGGQRSVKAVANPENFSRIVVLDTWLLNLDRYSQGLDGRIRKKPENLLLSEEGAPRRKFLLKAIDQGHCFTGASWSARDLRKLDTARRPRVYGLFPEFHDKLDRHEIEETLARAASVSESQLEAIIASVPSAWGLSVDEGRSLIGFVKDRAAYLRKELPAMIWPQGSLGGGRW